MGEVIAGDSVSVTKPGGGTFTARVTRGAAVSNEMRDAGYLPGRDIQIVATASALTTASYTPAVNDEIAVAGVVYVLLTVRTDAAFTYMAGQREA